MQLDQLLQGNNIYVLLGACCCGLCVVGLALSILGPFVNIAVGIVGMILDLASTLFELGPVPGCGCVIVAALVGAVLLAAAIMVSLTSTCGTPQATNFCTLFGR
jgi:hypothetical protein